MSVSFSFNAKLQSNRIKKSSHPAQTDSPARNYVREFRSGDAPPPLDSEIKPIASLPNQQRSNKKLINLPNLPTLSQSNGDDTALQFELDPGSNPEAADGSMGYGLNVRHPPLANGVSLVTRRYNETLSDFELRKLRDDMEKLPDDTGMEDFTDVPVDGFAASILSGYGWKEGVGIGRNAKEDVTFLPVTKKAGRGGLGFTDEFPDAPPADSNGIAGANSIDRKKERVTFSIRKKVRIVNGRDMGTKGKVVEVSNGGDFVVLRISRSDRKVRARSRDVAEVGSVEEERCLRRLKELKNRESEEDDIKPAKKIRERASWVTNHIKVRIISRELMGGRLFSEKGRVVDVVGPGKCDVLVDKRRELVQGVGEEFLETALPTRGGAVLVLYGRHKGVYGRLMEKDVEKEVGVIRDEDTHELLHVRLDQIAEYVGDPSEIGY